MRPRRPALRSRHEADRAGGALGRDVGWLRSYTEPGSVRPNAQPHGLADDHSNPGSGADADVVPGMMLRGIPMLREIDAEAARYANALAAELDEREPGHTHTVVCTSVMFLWMAGAHTPCQVTTDTGTPVVWTALTQEHPDPPGGGRYIEFTVGERTDVNPWPPNLPPVTPPAPTS